MLREWNITIGQTSVPANSLGWRLLVTDLHEHIRTMTLLWRRFYHLSLKQLYHPLYQPVETQQVDGMTSSERRIRLRGEEVRCLSVTQGMCWNILAECAECCRIEDWWNGLNAAVITSPLTQPAQMTPEPQRWLNISISAERLKPRRRSMFIGKFFLSFGRW